MSPTDELKDQLRRTMASAIEVQELPDGRIAILTPFGFPDGDGLPIVAERINGAWELSDDGVTISRLLVQEFQFTDLRSELLDEILSRHRASVADHVIRRSTDSVPHADDLVDMISAIVQVADLELTARDVVRQLFQTDVVTFVRSRFRKDAVIPNWSPARDTHGAYKSDALVKAAPGAKDTVMFSVASAAKADRAVISMQRYELWDVGVRPLVVLDEDQALPSPVVYRLQEAAGPDENVIRVRSRHLLPVERALQQRGIETAVA